MPPYPVEDPSQGQGTSTYEAVMRKHKDAKNLKTPWASLFDEAFDYTMPTREGVYENAPGEDNMEHIFDETGMIGVEEFVSRLKDGICPAYQNFSELDPGTLVPQAERERYAKLLEPVTQYIFETINESNFHTVVIESLLDMSISIGTLAVYETDPIEPRPFYCRALPMSHMNFRDGPFGDIDFWSRERKILVGEIKVAYPEATLSTDLNQKDNDDEVTLVECIYRNYEREVESYDYYLLYEPDQAILLQDEFTGIGSNPWISFRWTKLAGETWSRGPVIKALPSIRTANLVVQMTLENAEIAMSGIYTAEDDGVVNVNNIRLLAGTIIPTAPGSRGLQAINGAGNFDVSELILSDLRQNIRKALYNEVLGAPTGTPMSAREVSERMQELYRIAGPNFIRLISELIDPFIKRVVYILRKRGLIDLPTINGRDIAIKATSPLARSQDTNDVVNFGQFAELVTAAYGPETFQLSTKQEDAIPWLSRKLSIPAQLLREEAEQQQIMNQMGGPNGQETDENAANDEAAAAAAAGGAGVVPFPTA